MLSFIFPADLGNHSEPGGDFQAVIVAGDPNGTPSDSPSDRVNANTATSPFAGVGSLQINTRRGTYICTATPFDSTHVLTAGHCIDINNDGLSNKKDGITSIYFQLNLDVDPGTDLVDERIKATSWLPHPEFTGFNRPSINDDLAVVTLSTPIPAGVPIYSLATADMDAGTNLHMVGYGQSGSGVNGYTVGASWTVKRDGENEADAFYTQDDAGKPPANEVFRFDFDGPTGNGTFGGGTLGNDKETTLGGGDSGGPSFALVAGSYQLIGVNTFTQGFAAPKFGSLGGGINIFPYVEWINSVATGVSGSSSGGSNAGGSGPHGNLDGAFRFAVASTFLPESFAEVTMTWAAHDAQADRSLLGQLDGTLRDDRFTLVVGQPDFRVAEPVGTQATVATDELDAAPAREPGIWDEEDFASADSLDQTWLDALAMQRVEFGHARAQV